jgi:hypothetical protein
MDTARAPMVRRRLREAKRFSWTGFGVTVAASLLGALVPGAIGAGPNATLIATLVTTVLAASGLTAKDGSARGVKAIAVTLLAAGAVVLTVTGVTVLDLARGVAVTSGRTATFPVVPDAAQTPPPAADAEPRISVPDSVACGEAVVGETTTCTISVRSVGATALQVTGTDVDGTEFVVDCAACTGTDLLPGKRCTLDVRFTPSAPGARVADLTIRHNASGPPSFVELTGQGLPASPPANG